MKKKLCKTDTCTGEPEEDQEDERYLGLCTDCRMEEEVAGVIETMRMDFPTVADYNVLDNASPDSPEYAEILDKEGQRIGTISERQLSRYWNYMEGG